MTSNKFFSSFQDRKILSCASDKFDIILGMVDNLEIMDEYAKTDYAEPMRSEAIRHYAAIRQLVLEEYLDTKAHYRETIDATFTFDFDTLQTLPLSKLLSETDNIKLLLDPFSLVTVMIFYYGRAKYGYDELWMASISSALIRYHVTLTQRLEETPAGIEASEIVRSLSLVASAFYFSRNPMNSDILRIFQFYNQAKIALGRLATMLQPVVLAAPTAIAAPKGVRRPHYACSNRQAAKLFNVSEKTVEGWRAYQRNPEAKNAKKPPSCFPAGTDVTPREMKVAAQNYQFG